jgi:peroxisomal 2,4-dienoyl-CoA reductase
MTSIFKPDLMQGKTIFITGGATGICYGISKAFLEHKAKVCIVSRKIANI